MNKIKLILADDEVLFRKGVLFLLEREENFEIIYEASNGNEVIEFLKFSKELPDIILMDLKMPGINGVEATKIIHNKFPSIKIIALSSYNTKSFIANMIDVGASSYLVKTASPKEMIHTIKEVADKGFYYNETVIEVIQENSLSNKNNNKTVLDEDFLTAREKEVMLYLCKQLNATEIGDLLFISPRTVEGHRNNLLLKTNSKNIAGLVVFAIQNKIIDLKEI